MVTSSVDMNCAAVFFEVLSCSISLISFFSSARDMELVCCRAVLCHVGSIRVTAVGSVVDAQINQLINQGETNARCNFQISTFKYREEDTANDMMADWTFLQQHQHRLTH